MGSRTITLRKMVAFLVTALLLLWAFAAWMTLRDGANLLGVNELNAAVAAPSEPLFINLQEERRASAVYLAGTARDRADLDARRRDTDAAAARFAEQAQRWQATAAGSDETDRLVGKFLTQLDRLDEIRRPIEDAAVDRATAVDGYTRLIDSLFQIYGSLGKLDDEEIANTTSALIDLKRAWEVMSQEEALLAGALAAGRITQDEHVEFTKLVGVYRFQIQDTIPKLSAADQTSLRQFVDSAPLAALQQYEDQVIDGGPTDTPRLATANWQTASQDARKALNGLIQSRGKTLVAQAIPVVVGVLLRLLFATGLGALMVVASLVASRYLVRRMDRLRRDAHDLATRTLPDVVDRLSKGEKVEVDTEAPDLAYGGDELGQVGDAFNAVQHTALRAAVGQAELRRDVADMFLSIARRTQALVHRQLTALTEMERQEEDAETLERLFDLDHLATRMRRNAENLIVLTGAATPRTWKRNVPMIDVVRGAVAEVENYTRVTVLPMADAGLAGRAVSDATHLLAELIENALSFSPPTTPVHVSGQLVANGYAIEIEDRGLGMSAEDIDGANRRLASPEEFRLSGNSQLGLFVVARLADRLGARVHLKQSPYGGTAAVVLIPQGLVTGPVAAAPAVTGGGAGLNGSDAETQFLAVVGTRQGAGSPMSAGQTTAPVPPRPHARPAPAQDAADSAPAVTVGGLPKRVRRAAPAPTGETPALADREPAADRDPEAVRRRMSSFQAGTRRGRAAAADENTEPGPTPSPSDR